MCEFPNYLAPSFPRYLAYDAQTEKRCAIWSRWLHCPNLRGRSLWIGSRYCSLTSEDKRLLKAVAREAGIGYRTAQRWKMRYRKYGLAGLARDDRSDRGQRRAITAELKEILEALALEKPPSAIAALHRQICKIG
jgi:hypothetical protein